MTNPIYGLDGQASLAPTEFRLARLIKANSPNRIKFGFIERHTLRLTDSNYLKAERQTGDWPVVLEPAALAALIKSDEATGIDCLVSFQSFTDGSRRAIARLFTEELY